MKIKIPRTIAEPWTILWAQIRRNNDMVVDIYHMLRGNFLDMKKSRVLPSPQGNNELKIPVYLVRNILRDLALNHGASDARVQSYEIEHTDNTIGYEYRVQYKVGKRQIYTTRWFGSKP